MPQFLLRPQAAAYVTERGLPICKSTLAKFASVGGGPLYRRFGTRVVYTPEDLDQWIESRLGAPRRSTAEAA